MNKLKYLFAIAALTGALTMSAKADLQFVGAVPKNGSNSPDSNLAALTAFGVDTTGFTLINNYESGLGNPISVRPGDYLVIHYGRGHGGSNPGGSLEFYLVINGETSVTVPQNGNVGGFDPYGHGGVSSVREFGGTGVPTPDGGATIMLLGAALGSLGMARRFLKR